ncbi:hypothetical protein PoB_005620000 [Plakobranchus ocellatus]|uniref:Uncharacterized protein n=1 Tax=Plakobranchus ocellatus TaxID=259542 RepID=A0AAV4CAF4_9GAST|nr:hypothetical protein PoB_005620000 [Plakobranchus ocellatus]
MEREFGYWVSRWKEEESRVVGFVSTIESKRKDHNSFSNIVGSSRVRSRPIGSDQIRFGRVRSGRVGSGRIRLGSVGSDRAGSRWVGLGGVWSGQIGFRLSRSGLIGSGLVMK